MATVRTWAKKWITRLGSSTYPNGPTLSAQNLLSAAQYKQTIQIVSDT
jgi:hypothetical protein